jgi:biopolymer transport protein ExbB
MNPADVALPRDLTLLGMFLNSDLLVKLIILAVIIAQIVSLSLWLSQGLVLTRARRRLRAILRELEKCRTIADAAEAMRTRRDAVAGLIQSVFLETRRAPAQDGHAIKERIQWDLERLEASEGDAAGRALGFLAFVALIAPLAGLFGTIWSLSFQLRAVAAAGTPNLSALANGLASALLPSLIALCAAIIAATSYIVILRSSNKYKALLADASASIMQLLSYDLEHYARSIQREIER